MSKEIAIRLQLLSVKEDSFWMFPDNILGSEEKVNFKLNFSFNSDASSNKVTLPFAIEISLQDGRELLKIEATYLFWVDNLQNLIKENGDITSSILPKHLLNVAIGTTRGMIVQRTSGTYLEKLVLPIINIQEQVITKE